MMAAIWSALAIGFLGSFHCIGMCGPIALSLPYQGRKPLASAANVLLYNLGRVITYGLLGAVIGLVGKGFFLAGAQSYLSIGLGLFLLVVALFSIDMESQLLRVPIISRLNQWVTRQLGRIIGQGGPLRLLGIGALNGLLPCGLVYVAIVGAIGTGTALYGALYMAAFGLGTLPLMMATALAGQFVPLSWRRSVRKLLPVFLAGFALLFIMRGLNFDVPIDLRFWDNMQDAPMCH
ncbi:sulfite exporter TauE/SafE family protein [Phaeodactylibacter luteus]|uniref:Sulfite exporter TauE/SafE family protein n=2 Tax=Phaeodactylibacter luteus TaxID=1564516 RepID=A0A5C6RFU5_9BACT|nr:sulfite exporter TauE/SafE family protein [Phaeodactylibacter luteus]